MLSAACQATSDAPTPTATEALRPYHSETPTTARGPDTPTAELELTPGPTPTPFKHVIEEGDTLLVIAARYGVSLETLLAANPGINPRLLSVGQEVIIPDPEGGVSLAALPTATPVPFRLLGIRCFPTPSDGLWCIATAENTRETAIEGLTAALLLLNEGGTIVDSAVAYGPLGVLPPGGLLPLAAFFPPPAPDFDRPHIEILAAVEATGLEDRYAPVSVAEITMRSSADGLRWEIQGVVQLPPEAVSPAGRASVLAIGIDSGGLAVGFAKWEAERGMAPGEALAFEMQVFSLGPPIERVLLLAEARPEEQEAP